MFVDDFWGQDEDERLEIIVVIEILVVILFGYVISKARCFRPSNTMENHKGLLLANGNGSAERIRLVFN